MTKLQMLNSFMTKRLMTALDDIMEMVGGTLLQYELETERIRRENEFLRRRLQEVDTVTSSPGPEPLYSPDPPHSASLSAPDEASPAGLQNWSSGLEQEPEPTGIQQQNQNQNRRTTNQHVSVKSETLTFPADPPRSGPENESTTVSNGSTNSNECVWRNQAVKTCAVNQVMGECNLPKDIKTEPLDTANPPSVSNAESCSLFAHSTDPESADSQNLHPKSDMPPLNAETIYGTSEPRADLETVNYHINQPRSLPRAFLESVNTNMSYNVLQTTGPMSSVSDPSYSASHQTTDPGSVDATFPDYIGGQIDSNGLLGEIASDSSVPLHHHPTGGQRAQVGVKGKGSYVCPQCGKFFSHRSRLKVHTRIHTGEKPYACGQCGKRFNNDGTLRNHRRVHLQLRLYGCPVCARSFKDAYTCRKHLRIHTRTDR